MDLIIWWPMKRSDKATMTTTIVDYNRHTIYVISEVTDGSWLPWLSTALDKEIYLRPRSWKLFDLMFRHQEQVLPRERIEAYIWNNIIPSSEANLRELVRVLRSQLIGTGFSIKTYRAYGHELIYDHVNELQTRGGNSQQGI